MKDEDVYSKAQITVEKNGQETRMVNFLNLRNVTKYLLITHVEIIHVITTERGRREKLRLK